MDDETSFLGDEYYFPLFDGFNPIVWIFMAEQFFEACSIVDNDQKLRFAFDHLDGDSLDWFVYFHRNGRVNTWEQFLDEFTYLYDFSDYRHLLGESWKLHRNSRHSNDDLRQPANLTPTAIVENQPTTIEVFTAINLQLELVPDDFIFSSQVANKTEVQAHHMHLDFSIFNSEIRRGWMDKGRKMASANFTDSFITDLTSPKSDPKDAYLTPAHEANKNNECGLNYWVSFDYFEPTSIIDMNSSMNCVEILHVSLKITGAISLVPMGSYRFSRDGIGHLSKAFYLANGVFKVLDKMPIQCVVASTLATSCCFHHIYDILYENVRAYAKRVSITKREAHNSLLHYVLKENFGGSLCGISLTYANYIDVFKGSDGCWVMVNTMGKDFEKDLVVKAMRCYLFEIFYDKCVFLLVSTQFKRSYVSMNSNCAYLLSFVDVEVCRRLILIILGSQVAEQFLILPYNATLTRDHDMMLHYRRDYEIITQAFSKNMGFTSVIQFCNATAQTSTTENAPCRDRVILDDQDFAYNYFGFNTMKRSYLLKIQGKVVERPQHILMRIYGGIHKDTSRIMRRFQINANALIQMFCEEEVLNYWLIIDLDGLCSSVNVQESGPGVFYHEDWIPMMTFISMSCRCIAIDFPCHGGSELQDEAVNGATHGSNLLTKAVSNLLCQLFDQITTSRVTFLRYLMGAHIALYMTLKCIDKVQGAIFIAGNLGLADQDAREMHKVKDDFRAKNPVSYGLELLLDTWYCEELKHNLSCTPNFTDIYTTNLQHPDLQTPGEVGQSITDLTIAYGIFVWDPGITREDWQCFTYMPNLEDKVRFEGGGIVID